MRLKVIFSRCMEHRRTKVSLLNLYRHFLLHFQKSGEPRIAIIGAKFSHTLNYRWDGKMDIPLTEMY